MFEYNSGKLISGGQDRSIKTWDTNTGSLSHTLYGCLGSVLDLSITHDNRSIIAASSSNNLYVWDVTTGRVRHTLTGHTDKVCAVDVSKISTRHVVSAAYDRTIKVWDCERVSAPTQSFSTATAILFASAWMDRLFVQAMLMGIFVCGIFRQESYLVKLLHIRLLLHLYLCLEMEVLY